MNKSKKLMGKRYIRFERAKRSLKKNRKKAYSKKLRKQRHKNNNRHLRSKRYRRKGLNRRKSYSNMSGGGLPFGGTIKGSRENMIGNLCALNNVRPTTDTQLSGI